MEITIVEKRVLEILIEYFNEDGEAILAELKHEGDAELDSIYFLELIPFLEAEYNISIHPDFIHNEAKRSLKLFCQLVENLIQ